MMIHQLKDTKKKEKNYLNFYIDMKICQKNLANMVKVKGFSWEMRGSTVVQNNITYMHVSGGRGDGGGD